MSNKQASGLILLENCYLPCHIARPLGTHIGMHDLIPLDRNPACNTSCKKEPLYLLILRYLVFYEILCNNILRNVESAQYHVDR